ASEVVHLSATVRTMTPGYRFTLVDHPTDSMNREYLITHVSHRATQRQSAQGEAGGEGTRYEAQVRAIPADVPYRCPRKTPRPVIIGSQTAVVVGPDSEEIYTDDDGYADTSTLYAKGFNSIQGLAYHAGTVYVMHAPLLTSLRDTTGDSQADQRKDLVNGIGLPPEKNSNRLHCANGVVVGHDGWLYLALGDRGCDVKRYEGDRLLFRQGGILRCRPDGRDLHVFSGGLRNIYDVALDEELNVFVRDNENDGGDYMIRVCHSFHGADHGYPYLYYERPHEAMLPLADLGRGSSAGGTSYLEAAFPKEYRESLFFCEWGRAVVRYHLHRVGGSFAPMQEIDFAAAAPTDPYGLKPTDLVVDYDGSLLISDWGDGQRPKRGRARIYRITHVDAPKRANVRSPVSEMTTWNQLFAQLNSNSYHSRVAAQDEIQRRGPDGVTVLKQAIKAGKITVPGRMHAVWIMALGGGKDSVDDLFHLAATDSDHRVRAQAVRAIADVTDPILTENRVAARQGDPKIASRLAALVKHNQDPQVVLEVLVALGRLHWSSAPDWLREHWSTFQHDSAINHAAQQLLRRAHNWPAVLKLLDESDDVKPNDPGLRTLALRAVADRGDKTVVDGLITRLKTESNSGRRGDYIDLLSRVYKQPAPWVYWGFRPAPRPANGVEWTRTEAIENTLNGVLADSDAAVRMLALKRMQREKISIRIPTLATWLLKTRDAEQVKAVLDALKLFQPSEVQELHEAVVRDKSYADKNRLSALASFSKGLDASQQGRLLIISRTLDEGEVLAALLRDLGTRVNLQSDQLLLEKLDSKVAVVRSAAMDSLAMRNVSEA
ncbi:MAG: HEAT repeat domain-containing protein, partial [Planctomycetes bacterium]|nr:HEAT repeat domain-containing protein [Planctomycetota bacterium]